MPTIENFITARELAETILALPADVQDMPLAIKENTRHFGILKNSTRLVSHLEVKTLDHKGYAVYPSGCYSKEQRQAFKSIVVLGERHDLIEGA